MESEIVVDGGPWFCDNCGVMLTVNLQFALAGMALPAFCVGSITHAGKGAFLNVMLYENYLRL